MAIGSYVAGSRSLDPYCRAGFEVESRRAGYDGAGRAALVAAPQRDRVLECLRESLENFVN